MIGFGVRLTLRGGREAAVRLIVTAGAVALGVGLLLVTLAGVNGVTKQDSRGAWLSSGDSTVTTHTPPAPDPVWALQNTDLYRGKQIDRVDVAATGPRPPVPPGLTRLPGPGEYYASPALRRLLSSAPAAELADRFPGRDAGTIGDAGLPSPETLTIVVGHTAAELSKADHVALIDSIATGRNLHAADKIKLTLSVVATAMIFPVLVFIGTATRLSAARREQRFAAMRLFGATPRQVSVVSAVESTLAAALGTVAGFALFAVFRTPLSMVRFTGQRFHAADFVLNATDVLAVAVGVPIAAAVAARIALRRVRISPLGVSRRVTPAAPRAWRVLPLLAGVTELAFFVGRRPATTNGQIEAYVVGVVVMMAGLQIAGPWLTMAGARALARRARRPAALIAARRLADDPRAGFRAISGLVLALFVASGAVGVITSMIDRHDIPADELTSRVAASTISAVFEPRQSAGQDPPVFTMPSSIPDTLREQLHAVPGVQEVLVVHANPAGFVPIAVHVVGGRPVGPPVRPVEEGVLACADLARVSGLGRCADGATVAEVSQDLSYSSFAPAHAGAAEPLVWASAADVSLDRLAALPVLSVVVTTDGSPAAIERSRTLLETAYPSQDEPRTGTELNLEFVSQLTSYQHLADAAILASLVVAGCSLAAAVVGGLNDRKRPFSLLRLTGVQLRTLRRIVGLECVVPLAGVAVVAAGAGFLAAQLFLEAQLKYSLRPPGVAYYLTVGVGLVATLGIIASTLPLLRRITGPDTARNE